MCWPFKKKTAEKSRQQTCNHKYKDFPWYIVISYYDTKKYTYMNDWRYTLKVMAPYVCVKCKHRRDEQLQYYESGKAEQRDAKVAELQRNYPDDIRPAVEVEGMIKDEQLVDREYLRLIDEFYHPEDTLGKIDLFSEIQKVKAEVCATPGIAVQIGG